MSTVKFDYQPYKLYEPQFHPQRPIIVDADALESPETVTLRYEEEAAARANGGCLREDSPPGLSSKAVYSKPQPPQMHAFESARTYQEPQYQYSAQSFSNHQSDNVAAAAQLNQLAFAANGSASQYMTPVVPTLTSYQPTSGMGGSKVEIKISAPYDLIAVTSHFYLAFGQHRCAAHAVRDAHDATGFGYVVTGNAPHFEDTRSPSASVPVSLLIQSPDAQPLATIDLGTFTYHDTPVGSDGSPPEDVTRKISQSPEQRASPPKQEQDQLPDSATNTYGYAPAGQQATASAYDPAYTDNNNNNNGMMGSYSRNSYATDYSRHIPPPLKASSPWGVYGPALGPARSNSNVGHASHTTITRPSITSLPAPASGAPQLIRTSTIQPSGSPSSGQFGPYALYSTKAVLKINGDLDQMANNWSKEEWENRRRIVLFTKQQQGSTLSTKFRPVSVNERPINSICISCIWWAEKSECFVTSVDAIHLLEQLVAAPNKFTVEEKNRIRRNLEGFRPLTVSKAKSDSEEFFKIIMGFPNPKPRNIEKDVKVFPWKILAQALKKIISKYSASPSSTLAPGPALLTPVSSTSPGLFPPPPHNSAVHDGVYTHHDAHALASPRSLSGGASNWAGYAGRSIGSEMKSSSPTVGGIRMPSIPSYQTADARQTNGASSYGLPQQTHGRWDTTVTNGYMDATAVPAYTSHQHQSQVYGTGAYGDGGQRA